MHRIAGRPNPPKGFGNVEFARLFGLVFNTLVVVAFILGLLCCSMPGLHALREQNLVNFLLAPLYFLADIHIDTLLGLLSAFNPKGNSLITYITILFLPCMLLWLAIVWSWVYYTVCIIKSSAQHRQRFSWWFAPIMLCGLSIVWVTHIPVSINFTFHKAAFEKLADRVMIEPSGMIDFTPNQQMGPFSISGALRLSNTIASIETTSNQSLWAHEGFVRDLARKPGGLKANTFNLAPESNLGDQKIFYLSDGWYVFQNLFD